jgi:threonyl-tRNA synthetase
MHRNLSRQNRNNRREIMTDLPANPDKALIILGCPEAPAQQALAFHVAHNLRKRCTGVLIAGNPSVLSLLKVSDPEKHYVTDTMVLEKCIAEVVEKKRDCDLCVVFAHNDAAIAYAATMRHLLPERRLVVIVFGKDPGPLADEINFPCEKIIDKAVHNPMQLRKKINEMFGWAA